MTSMPNKNKAPGPTGLLFLKVLAGYYRDPIKLFADLHQQYGDIVRLEGAGYCAHLITQPEHIKYVLQDNSKNYQISGIFDETTPVVGKGLTTNNGQSWLKQRRMVQGAFQHQYIEEYGKTIISTAEPILDQWHGYIKNDTAIDINAETQVINLQILGRLLFSVDLKNDDPILEALGIVRKVTIDRVRSIIKLPTSQRFKQAVETLDKFTYAQIAQRRN